MNTLHKPNFLVSLVNALKGKETMVNYQIVICLLERDTYWYEIILHYSVCSFMDCHVTPNKGEQSMFQI